MDESYDVKVTLTFEVNPADWDSTVQKIAQGILDQVLKAMYEAETPAPDRIETEIIRFE